MPKSRELAPKVGSVSENIERTLTERPATSIAEKVEDIRVKARIPLQGARRVIAERMVQSLQTAAQLSFMTEVDVTKLVELRKSILAKQEEIGARISLQAFFVMALTRAIEKVPIANASIVEDEIIIWDDVNVGIAVSLPGDTEWTSSLIVPVIKNANRKFLKQISIELRDLVARARDGKLNADDITGGTITLSSSVGLSKNWGVSTPVLNLPQAMIIQPGTMTRRPVVINDNDDVEVRTIMPLSITFDHRILDGEPVGHFVNALQAVLADPELMLL